VPAAAAAAAPATAAPAAAPSTTHGHSALKHIKDSEAVATAGSPASTDAKFKPKPAAADTALQQKSALKPHRGPHMPDEAATAPVIDGQPQQQPDSQTLPVTPAMPPTGLAEGQLLQPMVAAAVPLPSDALTGSFNDATTDSTGLTTAANFGCRKMIPRGMQCGGSGGHCATVAGVLGGAGSNCRDEPFAGACCASGTVCVRKSEAIWVCAAGHGFVRRMLA
jgi:hypothetical protein